MPYKKIVVGVDLSPSSMVALRQAAALARQEAAELLIATVTEAPASADRDLAERARRDDALAETLESARELGVEARTVVETGDPAEALVRLAEQERADLVVVGNKGMAGARRFLLGSVPNKISHHAPCDVLIVQTT